MKRKIAILSFLLCVAAPARAQMPPQQPQQDPLGRFLYPPDLIMGHQQDIGLRDDQRTAIMSEIRKAQDTFMDRQWAVVAETDKLGKLLQAKAPSETDVLQQVDRVLQIERDVKRTQIALLLRLKGLLTDQQRARLDELRPMGPQPGPMPHPPGQ
jgi:hypothetical protein